MKRSLVSLAAMAAVGAASRHNVPTLFGMVDLTEPAPARLHIEPERGFWLEADAWRLSEAIIHAFPRQIGKTAWVEMVMRELDPEGTTRVIRPEAHPPGPRPAR